MSEKNVSYLNFDLRLGRLFHVEHYVTVKLWLQGVLAHWSDHRLTLTGHLTVRVSPCNSINITQ